VSYETLLSDEGGVFCFRGDATNRRIDENKAILIDHKRRDMTWPRQAK
jgi:hypothetical protein